MAEKFCMLWQDTAAHLQLPTLAKILFYYFYFSRDRNPVIISVLGAIRFFFNDSFVCLSVHIFNSIAKPVDALPLKSIEKDRFWFCFMFFLTCHEVTYTSAVITRPHYYLWCLSITICFTLCTEKYEARRLGEDLSEWNGALQTVWHSL